MVNYNKVLDAGKASEGPVIIVSTKMKVTFCVVVFFSINPSINNQYLLKLAKASIDFVQDIKRSFLRNWREIGISRKRGRLQATAKSKISDKPASERRATEISQNSEE